MQELLVVLSKFKLWSNCSKNLLKNPKFPPISHTLNRLPGKNEAICENVDSGKSLLSPMTGAPWQPVLGVSNCDVNATSTHPIWHAYFVGLHSINLVFIFCLLVVLSLHRFFSQCVMSHVCDTGIVSDRPTRREMTVGHHGYSQVVWAGFFFAPVVD